MADNNEPVKLFYSKKKPVSLFYSKPLDIKENDSVPLFCNVNEYNNQFCNDSLTPNTVQEPQTIQNTSVQTPEVYTTCNNGYYSVAPIVQVQPNYSIINDTLSFENNIYSAVPPQVVEIFQNEARNNLTELQGILQNNKDYNEFLTRIAQLISTQAKLIVKDFQTYKLYYYDGKIFKEGEKNFIISYIRGLYDSLMDVLRNNSKFKHDSSCANNIFKNIQQIAPMLKEPQNLENYIVFNNCILKLTTMELLPHSPQNFFKTLINVDYNPQAQYYHPNFKKLICTYTRGDSILNTRLLQALGLCITNDNNAKAIICFIGVGNSGKSFLIKFLSSLIDSSLITSIDPSHLGDKFALSRIYGKLICTCMDMKNAPISKGGVSVIKQISGNDMVTAEYKNSNKYIEFVSHCHMILGSNYEIISDGEDQAFENRKVVIPFKYAIDRENMETEDILLSKLENEKSAIINTLLYYYIQLRNNKYKFADNPNEKESYNNYVPYNGLSFSHSNYIKKFFDNHYEVTNNKQDICRVSDICDEYNNYIKSLGISYFIDVTAFSHYLSNIIGILPQKTRKGSITNNPVSCLLGVKHK